MNKITLKARSDVEILIDRFNDWADYSIFDLRSTADNSFFSDTVRFEARGGISWLWSAKRNIKRLAEAV